MTIPTYPNLTIIANAGSVPIPVGQTVSDFPGGAYVPYVSLQQDSSPIGTYSITLTDTSGLTTFGASANIPTGTVDGITITGNGTSSITITSQYGLSNLDTVLFQTLTYTVSAPTNGDTIQLSATGPNGETATASMTIQAAMACFVSGTRIATVNGPVPVEHLSVGDQVITARGEIRPIRWLGHVAIDCTALRHPSACYPVSVRAGAFGRNLPRRDLLLSSGHHVYAEGVLVPISALENGVTITRQPVSEVTYWHVELDTHDVILAEGLPTESYLDTGNRSSFTGRAGMAFLHRASVDSDAESQIWAASACAARAVDGQRVVNLRWRLLEEAKALGLDTTHDPGLQLLADDRPVTGAWAGEWLNVALPAGARTLRILSRAALPVWSNAANDDQRLLGLCINEVIVDGSAIRHDDPVFVSGFHGSEREDENAWRWTDGDAIIDVTGMRSLTMRVLTQAVYPASTLDPVRPAHPQAA